MKNSDLYEMADIIHAAGLQKTIHRGFFAGSLLDIIEYNDLI
jgi:hypothetical protein